MKILSNMIFATTIAAISTPPGKGGVAVIRISGPDAFSIGKKIFRPRGRLPLEQRPPRMQIWGDILYNNEEIDDGMFTYFKAPNSYTGEDIVEISCHGGVLVSAKVLESAFIAGAVAADKGEFTKRAFVNGKLSLTETEAIGLLLEAQSDAQMKLSGRRSRTKLSEVIETLRSEMTSLLGSVYARIDYPDEDLGEFGDEESAKIISDIIVKLDKLIATYKTGRAVKDGIDTVICGKPNVGKSTLYNLLLGEDAAIVTDIPGTTRDVLERKVPLGICLLHLYDTAGIRDGEVDAVEKIGILRSKEKMEKSELIFALFDSSRPFDSEDECILEGIKKSSAAKIAVITKNDEIESQYSDDFEKRLQNEGFSKVLKISAKTRSEEALLTLKNAVEELFTDGKINIGEDAVVSSARAYASLVKAREYLNAAYTAYEIGLPQDAVSSDVELALGAVSEVDGRRVSEEVVADIFSRFCVGK